MHYVDAPYPVRFKRVQERNSQKGDTFSFEVTPAMFEFMEKEFETPTEKEFHDAIRIDTTEN